MQRTAPTSERKGPQSKQRNAAVFLQVDVASQIKTALNPYNGRSNRNRSGFFGKKSHKLGARSAKVFRPSWPPNSLKRVVQWGRTLEAKSIAERVEIELKKKSSARHEFITKWRLHLNISLEFGTRAFFGFLLLFFRYFPAAVRVRSSRFRVRWRQPFFCVRNAVRVRESHPSVLFLFRRAKKKFLKLATVAVRKKAESIVTTAASPL